MRWMLIWFLTLGMYTMYTPAEMTVTDVSHGVVTFDENYTIEEAEAWRVGDRAGCILRDDEIIMARWMR